MTLTQALALVTGDEIVSKGMPDCGIAPYELAISVNPARPELGYAPSISGSKGRGHWFCIILDGGRECMKALTYWAAGKTAAEMEAEARAEAAE